MVTLAEPEVPEEKPDAAEEIERLTQVLLAGRSGAPVRRVVLYVAILAGLAVGMLSMPGAVFALVGLIALFLLALEPAS